MHQSASLDDLCSFFTILLYVVSFCFLLPLTTNISHISVKAAICFTAKYLLNGTVAHLEPVSVGGEMFSE